MKFKKRSKFTTAVSLAASTLFIVGAVTLGAFAASGTADSRAGTDDSKSYADAPLVIDNRSPHSNGQAEQDNVQDITEKIVVTDPSKHTKTPSDSDPFVSSDAPQSTAENTFSSKITPDTDLKRLK